MNTSALTTDTTLAWQTVAAYAPRFAGALIILFGGLVLSRWASALAMRGLSRTKIDPTFRPMISMTIHYAAIGVVLLVVLQQFGVQTASLLALLGTAGLAIGLALQGTLSNVAAGIVLLFLRPFEVGDQVKLSDQTGTVLGLALFNTQLRSQDGVDIFVPNTSVLQNSIVNMSHYPDSMMTVTLNVAAGADLLATVDLVRATLEEQPLIIKTLERTVTVENLTAAASQVQVKAWVLNAQVSDARTQYLCALRAKLKSAEISLA